MLNKYLKRKINNNHASNNLKSHNDLFFELDKKKKIILALKMYLLFFIITYIFYKSLIVSLITSLSFVFIYKEKVKEEINKMKEEFLISFKDFINIFKTATLTGDEPFTAFSYALCEYKKLEKTNKKMQREIEEILSKGMLYGNLGTGFIEFAKKVNIKEISRFSNLINIALKSSGNISDVLIETSEIISEKIELNLEIQKLFYEKKYELKIILIIPILIYFFLSITAKEYVTVMYESLAGYVALTISLILLVTAYIAGNKMMELDVW